MSQLSSYSKYKTKIKTEKNEKLALSLSRLRLAVGGLCLLLLD